MNKSLREPFNAEDAIVMGTVAASPSCSLTVETLEDHLKQSNYGENKARYLCYFHEGMPPRCVTCGQPIGAHRSEKVGGSDPLRVATVEPTPPTRGPKKNNKPPQSPKQQQQQQQQHRKKAINLNASHYNKNTMQCAMSVDDDDRQRLIDYLCKYCVEHIEKLESILFFHEDDIPALFDALVETYGPEPKRKKKKQKSAPKTCFLCEDRLQMKGETDIDMKAIRLEKAETMLDGMPADAYWHWYNHDRVSCDECDVGQEYAYEGMSAEEKQELKEHRQKHSGIHFFKCSAETYESCYTKPGGKGSMSKHFRQYCTRVVCNNCMGQGRHLRENSRFNKEDPEWRTSLLGCCGSPKLCVYTMACYYCCDHRSTMWEGNLVAFKHSEVRDYILHVNQGVCMPIFCIPCNLPQTLLADLVCFSITRIRDHEREMRARFGVAPHSTGEMVFCKHCAYVRLLREAEARGYPQPTCCSDFEDLEAIVAQHPPLPPVGGKKAPLVSAPAAASLI